MPSLALFEKRNFWMYSRDDKKWPELKAALEGFKGFYVVNADTRRLQGIISSLVDSNTDSRGWGAAHWLVIHSESSDSDEVTLLLQGLLQLGARPDLVAHGCWGNVDTPSHLSRSVKLSGALVACRPDLGVENAEGDTPAARARKDKNTSVAELFEDAKTTGFPTIAQLAEERKWWALHNLCRRGVVPDKEKLALHNGKDAIGWAVHHEEFAIAEELEYLLKGVVQPKNEGLEDKLVASKAAGLKKGDAQKEALEQKVDEQGEELKQLKADLAAVKKEGDQLKEMLLVNFVAVNEVHQGPKKDLAALKKNNSKRKQDLQEERDQQFEQLKRMKINSTADTSSLQDKGKSGHGARVDGRTTAGSKAAEGDEAEKVALQAENKALKEQVGHLGEVLKAQAALLHSFLKGDS